jgi:hypothetical protein
VAVEEPERRSLLRRFAPLLAIAVFFVGIAIFRLGNPTEGVGELDPVATVEFPATVEAGSVQTAIVEVTNPSASDIGALFVSFSLVGVGGGEDVPTPIVGPAAEPAVVAVEPEPSAEGEGVRFGFGELRAGETTVIEFQLRIPETSGRAANSIVVYDGERPERGGGVLLETTVQS